MCVLQEKKEIGAMLVSFEGRWVLVFLVMMGREGRAGMDDPSHSFVLPRANRPKRKNENRGEKSEGVVERAKKRRGVKGTWASSHGLVPAF